MPLTQAEMKRRYRAAHPEESRAYQRRWRTENLEKCRAASRASYARRRAGILEYKRNYRVANLESERAQDRRYNAEHREKKNEASRQWQATHRAEMREYLRQWKAAHRDETRAQQREASQRRRARRRQAFIEEVDLREVFARCRGRCHVCAGGVKWETAWPDPLSKTIDHLIPLSRGGTHEPANVSLAHWRCNHDRGAGRTPAQLWLLLEAA